MSRIQIVPIAQLEGFKFASFPERCLPIESGYLIPYSKKEDGFLILRSSADRKRLVLAGGKRDLSGNPIHDTTIRDCAVREALEELGIDLSSAKFSKIAIVHGGKYTWTVRKARENWYDVDKYIGKGSKLSITHNKSVIFSCEIPEGIDIPQKFDGRKLHQVRFRDSLRDSRISGIVKKAIRHLLDKLGD